MGFKNIEPGVWNYENEGDHIEGILIKKGKEVGPNNSNTYHLETPDGKHMMVWGTTILDSRMDFVKIDDYVRVTYKGKTKNKKGQDTKVFKVEVKENDDPEITEEKIETGK